VRLSSRAAQLLLQAKRHDLPRAALEKDIAGRREMLTALFNGDQWLDLQKLAPAVTDFVTSEEKRIKMEAQAAAESARSRRRHLIDSARSLIMLLERRGETIPDALRAIPGAAFRR